MWIPTAGLMLVLILATGKSASADASCPVREEVKYVSGQSMAEVFPPESKIIAEMGYYACHDPKRDDAALIERPGRERPILKLVRVLPGDRFELKPSSVKGEYNLLVNGVALKTPKGKLYAFSQNAYKMLHLYEETYKGLMPDKMYFVFGTEQGGSLDSARFGPVPRSTLLARVKLAH